ncbi:hypothetical protein GGF32_004179 [Allomyces javanicus]|nr:hypothetical protein GGF32_004179 [Allomyces javanicus]
MPPPPAPCPRPRSAAPATPAPSPEALAARIAAAVPLVGPDLPGPAGRRFHAQQLAHALARTSSTQSHTNNGPRPSSAPHLATADRATKRSVRPCTASSGARDPLAAHKQRERQIEDERDHRARLHAARASLRDRERQAVRLRATAKELDTEVRGYAVRREAREQQILESLLKESLKVQKEEEIRLHKLRKEQEQRAREEAARKREARLHYMRDQMKMLEEELAQAKLDEEVARRAQLEEDRRRKRERKAGLQRHIDLAKAKLAAEEAHDRDRLVELAENVKPRIVARARQSAWD